MDGETESTAALNVCRRHTEATVGSPEASFHIKDSVLRCGNEDEERTSEDVFVYTRQLDICFARAGYDQDIDDGLRYRL